VELEMSPGGGSTSLAPVFIAGCARSGTSILGEAIAAHPRVTYLYEASDLWRRFFPDRDDDRLGPEDAADAAACAGARAELEARLRRGGGEVLVEKNPKHALRSAFLARVFPQARFIHLIRDGRDTVASLMFRNRGAEWGHLKIPGWRELLARYPTQNHCRAAHQWREAVRCARREGGALGSGRYLELRYEDLVRQPETVLAQALAFLALAMDEAVARAAARIQAATPGANHPRPQERHFLDNHALRVGRYKENLSAEALREVEAICGDLLRELGYLP
jgi:hypothetical protein